METIVWYSYKGGVGRTLLLANTARFLSLCGKRVVALDFDLEAPGLHYKLGVEAGPGAIDFLDGILSSSASPPALNEMARSVPVPGGGAGALFVIPAGVAPDFPYWKAYGHLQRQLGHSALRSGLLEASLELLLRIEEQLNPDYLLIDARTGVSDLGGLATTGLADRVVVMTTLSRESLDGTENVLRSLRAAPVLREERGERKLEVILTRVPGKVGRWREGGLTRYDEALLREKLGTWTPLREDSVDPTSERQVGDPPRAASRATRLLSDSLTWMEKTFGDDLAGLARSARLRLEALDDVYADIRGEPAFGQVRDLDEHEAMYDFNVFGSAEEIGQDGSVRVADLRAISAVDPQDSMIVEYIADEAPEPVARWWFHTSKPPRIVILLDEHKRWIYGVRGPEQELVLGSSIPTLKGFEYLADPLDHSTSALLETVDRTSYFYSELVQHYVVNSDLGLYSSRSWNPDMARRILDRLASIEHDGLVHDLLTICARAAWKESDSSDEEAPLPARKAREELCALLWWRLPPRAVSSIPRPSWPATAPPELYGLRWLADLMGLSYDPDRAPLSVASNRSREPEETVSREQLEDVLGRHTIKYTWVEEGVLIQPEDEDREDTLRRRLPYHGFLGLYDPSTGTISIYDQVVASTADQLGLPERHLGALTRLHLSVLALLHLGLDRDGQHWESFSLVEPVPQDHRGGVQVIAVTQALVARALARLADPDLNHAFAVLSERQPPEYRARATPGALSNETLRARVITLRQGLPAESARPESD